MRGVAHRQAASRAGKRAVARATHIDDVVLKWWGSRRPQSCAGSG